MLFSCSIGKHHSRHVTTPCQSDEVLLCFWRLTHDICSIMADWYSHHKHLLANFCLSWHAGTLTGWERPSITWHSKVCVTMALSMPVLLCVISEDHTWLSLSIQSIFTLTKKRFCPEETTTSNISCTTAVFLSMSQSDQHLYRCFCDKACKPLVNGPNLHPKHLIYIFAVSDCHLALCHISKQRIAGFDSLVANYLIL